MCDEIKSDSLGFKSLYFLFLFSYYINFIERRYYNKTMKNLIIFVFGRSLINFISKRKPEILSKTAEKIINKKIGISTKINIHELTIDLEKETNKVYLHANIDLETNKTDILNLLN